MPNSAAIETVGGRLKQSLAALKAGQESFGQFAEGLFSDFAQLHQQVGEAEKNLYRQRKLLEQERQEFETLQAQRTASRSDLEQRLQSQLEQIEKDRQALEEELAVVRGEAASMAATIAEQKRQLADEHAEWADELKQLRKILDKQATWIAAQAGSPPQAVPNSRAAAKVGPSVAATNAQANQHNGQPFQPGGGVSVQAASTRSRVIPASGVAADSPVATT